MKKTKTMLLATVFAVLSLTAPTLAAEESTLGELEFRDNIVIQSYSTQWAEPVVFPQEERVVVMTTSTSWTAADNDAPVEPARAGREVGAAVQTGSGGVYRSGWYNPELADGVIELVNAERELAGLAPLQFDPVLEEAAILRALESTVSWSHTRPDGSSWMTVCATANGENIAWGRNCYLTAGSVMEGWMNSPGHRENILRPQFTRIGVGCVQIGSEIYWVQLFGI